MSVTWFMLKSILATFVIISFLQLKVGKENKTLELHFTQWMKGLSASKRIQNIAEGGQLLTNDVIKEFTTEDGSRVLITKPDVKRHLALEKDRLNQIVFKDNKVVSRLVEGFKLDINDLTENAKEKLKEEVRKEIQKEGQAVGKSQKNPGTGPEVSNNENKQIN